MTTIGDIARLLEGDGLLVLGAFHPEPADGVPLLASGRAAGTLVTIGNAGPALWARFVASPLARERGDPLNRWTRSVVERAAAALGATALFPFTGPPYLPFQRWAQRAAAVWPSPIGLLIHPEYGLWHAYRAALALVERPPLEPPDPRPRPCDACAEQPCLDTCPVGAFTGVSYDVRACAAHLRTPAGHDCVALGCRARRACPVGRPYTYEPAQARFHMSAFLRALSP